MSPAQLFLATTGLVAAGALAAQAALARAAARARPACPAGGHASPPWIVRAARVAHEAVLTLAGVLLLPLALRQPRTRPLAPGEPRPVLLVHAHGVGALCRLGLGRRLCRGGRQVAAVGYGVPVRLEHAAARLERACARLRRETGAATVDVVAHGAGGLIARAWLRRRGHAAGVHRLVTLASPHQGTTCARPALHPGSRLVTHLAHDDTVPALVDVIAIYSPDDTVVVPAANGYYPGAFNIEIDGIGHAAMLVSRRVTELVRENLDAPAAATAAAGTGSHA
jgi:triacylglycerol lipase